MSCGIVESYVLELRLVMAVGYILRVMSSRLGSCPVNYTLCYVQSYFLGLYSEIYVLPLRPERYFVGICPEINVLKVMYRT